MSSFIFLSEIWLESRGVTVCGPHCLQARLERAAGRLLSHHQCSFDHQTLSALKYVSGVRTNCPRFGLWAHFSLSNFPPWTSHKPRRWPHPKISVIIGPKTSEQFGTRNQECLFSSKPPQTHSLTDTSRWKDTRDAGTSNKLWIGFIWIGRQYGTGTNLAPLPIWHRSQFDTGPIWHQEYKRVNLTPRV